MKNPEEYYIKLWRDKFPAGIIDSDFVDDVIAKSIKLAQRDAYNQAIEDSKLKIKYDVYHVEIETPTNNASYTSRKNEEFVDFLICYEDSILKLKIK